jgi:SAM-dependent methyltransferase
MMSGSAELRDVYERHYAAEGADAALYGGWRELCGEGKADHVAELICLLPEPPQTVADVGCGDGVLLTLLASRGVGLHRHGFEITERAVEIAAGRPEIERVERFDGSSLPVADDAYDLGVLSHVLEHVADPGALLAETARACRSVVLEVPLEANRSASRPAAQAGRREVGHLHRFSRAAMHRMVEDAGLRVEAELTDPLPREVHLYFATGRGQRARALAKAGVRRGLFTLAPRLAERTFTVHYACLCLPRRSEPRQADDRPLRNRR